MSLLGDFQSKEISRFPGLDSHSQPEESRGAKLARNISYEEDWPETRPGIGEWETYTTTSPGPGGNTIGGLRKIYFWLSASWSRLMMFSKGDADTSTLPFVTHANFNIGTREDVVRDLPATTYGVVWSTFGSRLLMAFLDSNGAGTTEAKIWNGLFNSALPAPHAIVDDIFERPLTETTQFTAAYSEPSAGVVTAGEHGVGLVFVTQNGHETRALELDAIHTATGEMNLRITLTPTSTWPSWIRSIKPLITTVQNPELFYFVPDTGSAPFIGTSTPVIIDISISDEELAVGATEATPWFSLITKSDVGNIKFVGTYGYRAVYMADINDAQTLNKVTHIFFSERDDPQRVFADQSVRFLPEKRTATTGFQLHGTYYVCGINWTYAFNDTTDVPVAWFPPEVISERIGVAGPACVTINTSRGIAWVAAIDGLYAFDGSSFPQLPTSYYQTPEWGRINWSAPKTSFQLLDDAPRETLRFLVPLDDADDPTHEMVWDYKKGYRKDQVRFALNDYVASQAALVIGGFDNVQHPTTDKQEIWYGDEDSNRVYRTKNPDDDASPYNDDDAGYVSTYRTPGVTPVNSGPLRHGAVQVRLTGAGDAWVDVYGYDQTKKRGAVMRDLTSGGEKRTLLLGFNSETAYVEVSNKGMKDNWWRLGWLKSYYKQWLRQR